MCATSNVLNLCADFAETGKKKKKKGDCLRFYHWTKTRYFYTTIMRYVSKKKKLCMNSRPIFLCAANFN